MIEFEDILNIVNYQCEPNEQEALQEIESYIKDKYKVSIYKLLIYDYGDNSYRFHVIFLKSPNFHNNIVS